MLPRLFKKRPSGVIYSWEIELDYNSGCYRTVDSTIEDGKEIVEQYGPWLTPEPQTYARGMIECRDLWEKKHAAGYDEYP